MLAARQQLPTIYPYRYFVTSGGLISYGIDNSIIWRRSASYVDRILKGEKPADLPVQAPTKDEMIINLKAAKALVFRRGCTAPMSCSRASSLRCWWGGGRLAVRGACAAAAQPGIGFLVSGAADSFAIFVDAFKQGMRDNGMVEDRDYVLDLRFADGDYSRFPTLAAEVVQRKPAAIVVTTISAARAAQRATATIPIVMTGLIDPVGQGLIASLARPGGNTTGLANLAQDVMPKLVEILRATFPTIRVIAILFNPANPANRELIQSNAGPSQLDRRDSSPGRVQGRG